MIELAILFLLSFLVAIEYRLMVLSQENKDKIAELKIIHNEYIEVSKKVIEFYEKYKEAVK